MLEYDCFPQAGAGTRQKVPVGIWKSSEKTGREQGCLWRPQQGSRLPEPLPTPRLLPPALVTCRRGGPSSQRRGLDC